MDTDSHGYAWRKIILRCLIVALVTGAVVAIGVLLEEHVLAVKLWIHSLGAWGGVVFVCLFVIGTSIFIPSDIFVFLAGAIFGLWWGFLSVVIAEFVAITVQFLIARFLIKHRVENFMERHSKFNAIDKAVSSQGLKIAFLLRLGPVPLAPLSYILGASRISAMKYLLASPGILPSLFAVTYYGVVAAHLTRLATGLEDRSVTHYLTMIGGVVVAVVTTVYIARVARRALKEADAL